MPRLTKDVREKMLEQNEGATFHTNYEGRNFRESRTYTITNRELHIRESGKSSWSDSRYDDTRVADDKEVHRFLSKFKDALKYDEENDKKKRG